MTCSDRCASRLCSGGESCTFSVRSRDPEQSRTIWFQVPLLATATHATRTQTRLTHVTDRPETFKQQPGQPPSRSWQAETHLCAFRGFERPGSRSVRTGSCTATLPRVASTVGISAHVLPTPTRQSSPFPRFQPHLPLDPFPRPYLLMKLVPDQSSSTHPYPISPIRTDP